jgi:hypothetical protein
MACTEKCSSILSFKTMKRKSLKSTFDDTVEGDSVKNTSALNCHLTVASPLHKKLNT